MEEKERKIPSITVIGSGVAGLQAALDGAHSGFSVYLVEENPYLGGIIARLDKTFPTDDCAACMMGPKLAEVAQHPRIHILAYTQVLQVDGEPGRFRLTLKKKARAVDPKRCIGCGLCAERCPVKVPDPFNLGLNERKAVYLAYPQAVPRTYTIDKSSCLYFTKGVCRLCEKVCPARAVAFEQTDEVESLTTGAIILAGGIEPFHAEYTEEYGYGRLANVLTSLEYERMLSVAGPFAGKIRRVSDGRPPKKLAWIQCVGSRDTRLGRGYCSAVCCMSAVKQAMITKEYDPAMETVVFYNDFRAYGKGFDRFFERAEKEHQVRFVRSLISRLVSNPEDRTLSLRYTDGKGGIREEIFDLVILSIGLSPHPRVKGLAEEMGLALNPYGFCLSRSLEPHRTSKEGVYVCGSFQGPKDIPDSVQQGSAAAAEAMTLLAGVETAAPEGPPKPPERDVRGEPPRIGVFVCRCGVNIAGVVDVPAVTDYARGLPHVAHAAECMFACSTDQQEMMKKAVLEHRLNRVVVAACTPRTHEPLFRETLRRAGLNPFLFDLANIREHDAWVHRHEPEAATKKAKDLVRMSIARAALLQPLVETSYPVIPSALIVGGGLAGLTAALTLAEQGHEVVVVEQGERLGGLARRLHYTEDRASPSAYVEDLARRVLSHPLITVHTRSKVLESRGVCGRFETTISVGDDLKEVRHGVTLIAVGAREHIPDEYAYGKDPRILTRLDFESLLALRPDQAGRYGRVVMIQCVGSREPEHPYCSRICCTGAVKNGLKLKTLNPQARVSILYRDLRTFGLREVYYQQARQEGIRFFRYGPDHKPEVEIEEEGLKITVFDEHLKALIRLEADLLVLNTAVRPQTGLKELAETFRLPLDQDGFFMEAHPKLRPLDFIRPGFFVCGTAQGPKFAPETVIQAKGAAARALTILSRKTLTAEGMVARVKGELCRGCGECEKTCLFDAVKVKEDQNGRKKAAVDEALCTGCGACNAACPTGAASPAHFEDRQILSMIKSFKDKVRGNE